MRSTLLAAPCAFALFAGCRDVTTKLPDEAFAMPAAAPTPLLTQHGGPPVVAGSDGPMRFVPALYDGFDLAHATATVTFVDRYYRAPANDGYNAVLDHVAAQLKAAGYGTVEGFELSEIETPMLARGKGGDRVPTQAWTPLSGRAELIASDGSPRVLHAFKTTEARDRTMLPVNTPSCDVTGGIALSLDELDAGEILVIEQEPSNRVISGAEGKGALAVVSGYIEAFNVDPQGKFRHLDAVQFRQLGAGSTLPVCMISPRSLDVVHKALDADPKTKFHFVAEVKFDERKLRTLCARVVGGDRPNEAVATVSHVQEPGACDNATGVAGLCETACSVARSIQDKKLPRPSRSLVFLWGDEYRQSSAWLESTKLTPIAGLSSDMTGESREKTGAIALLERMPDPGALVPLPPDAHTPWGMTPVDEAKLMPNGLALVARCAMLDVAQRDGGWETADHPFEGGSDHEEFINRGVPAALFWHFTDFAYHTSLDRMEHVDASEMRRTGVALMSTALALADPKPSDLDRYLRSLNEELKVRVQAAESASQPELAAKWRTWCDGARQWLRIECLRIPASELAAPTGVPTKNKQ